MCRFSQSDPFRNGIPCLTALLAGRRTAGLNEPPRSFAGLIPSTCHEVTTSYKVMPSREDCWLGRSHILTMYIHCSIFLYEHHLG